MDKYMLNNPWNEETTPQNIKDVTRKPAPEDRKIFKAIFFSKIQLKYISLLAGLMAGLMLVMPSLSLAQRENPAITKAITEGELNAKIQINTFSWFAWGYVGGPITVAVATFYKPPPPAGLLLGKSSGYIEAYTKAYKAKTRSLRFKYATIGCIAGIATAGALYTAYYYGFYGDWWWTAW